MDESDSDIEFESADEGESSELKADSSKILVEKNKNLKNSSYISNDCDSKKDVEENSVCFENVISKNKVIKETVIKDINPLNTELTEGNCMHNVDKNISAGESVKNENLKEEKNRFHNLEENISNNNQLKENFALDQNKEVKTDRIKLRFEERLEKSQKKSAKYSDQKIKEASVLKKLENLTVCEEKNSGWNWDSWKSSIFSTAASSVSVFTSQVSQGLGTVFETVEATLGAPPPEELAASVEDKKESKNENYMEKTDEVNKEMNINETSSGLFEGVSSLTKVIENTGSKVIMGGLDTLELIGKKTIDILTDGDPGFRKKRSYFANNNSLSEVLKEAKEKEKELSYNVVGDKNIEKTINYSVLFDNFQGIAHLEALELLSVQNKSKVQEFLICQSDEHKKELKEQFEKLKNICEDLLFVSDILDDDVDHNFNQLIENYIGSLKLNVNITNLQQMQKQIRNWLKECKKEQENEIFKESKELYEKGITSLAQLAANSIKLYHKIAELLLTKRSDISSSLFYAKQLTEMSKVLCLEVRIVAVHFSHCLNTATDYSSDPDSVTSLITNIYLEASNSVTYIQDAFQLLIPIFERISIGDN